MGSQGEPPPQTNFFLIMRNTSRSHLLVFVPLLKLLVQRMGVTHAKCHEVVFPDAASIGGERASAANSITLGRLLLVPAASFQVRLHACACACAWL